MDQIKKELSPIQNYFRFARNILGEDLLENFIVSAVASTLLIRLFLAVTGYPRLGGDFLHVAHMLWGGLLMLVALVILLGYLSRPAHELAAILGGLGFGTFIDEVGKFVTRDNNYFFQPTVAIIYVTFILIYISVRWIYNHHPLSTRENLANVFEILKQASINGLDKQDERMIVDLLEKCESGEPLLIKIREMLKDIRIVPYRQPHLLNRMKTRLDVAYQRIIRRWWFAGIVVAFFGFTAVTGFSVSTALIGWPWTIILGASATLIILLSLLQNWLPYIPNLQIPLTGGVLAITTLMMWVIIINAVHISIPFAEWALFACSSISMVLIITGIVYMARSRLKAYQLFHLAILVSVLLTQIFAFYQYQFYALIGLFLNLLILVALRYMLHREQIKLKEENGLLQVRQDNSHESIQAG